MRAAAIALVIAVLSVFLIGFGGLQPSTQSAQAPIRPFLSATLPAARVQNPDSPFSLLHWTGARQATRHGAAAANQPAAPAVGPISALSPVLDGRAPATGDKEWFPAIPDAPSSESNQDTGDYPVNHPLVVGGAVDVPSTPPPDSASPSSTAAMAASTETAAGEKPSVDDDTLPATMAATQGADPPVSADLSLAVSGLPPPPLAAPPLPVPAGTPVGLSLVLSNSGPDVATDIRVATPVLDNVVILSLNFVADGRIEDGVWILDQLAPGASVTRDVELLVTGAADGAIIFEVVAVNEPDPDSVPGNRLFPQDDWIAIDLVPNGGDQPCGFGETGIAGALYEDIDGDGRFAPDDEPGIPALRVQLIQVHALGPGQDGIIGETVTDAQGFYDFFGVSPQGLYRIAVEDFVLGPDVAVSSPNALDAPIEITAEDCYPNRNVGYLLLHTIEGRVWEDTNVDGQPDEQTPLTINIQIQLSQLGPGGKAVLMEIGEPDPVTGRFAFDNVRPGTYRVEPVLNYTFTTESSYVLTCRGGLAADAPPPPAQFGVVIVTPIELASFSATDTGAGTLVSWRTAVELENLGFYLYRSARTDGPRTRITLDLILGRGTSLGDDYQFFDEGGSADDWFWLEDLDWDLRPTMHGPVRVN